jgi:BirA family biotin operon repressor/biotin-[acetyl-CoA-carboxylase] ligase
MSGFVEWDLATRFIGRRTLVHERVPSTNDLAAERATRPGHDGLVLLAREQTAGRGQHGRSWHCPAGSGVLLSVLIFPPPPLRRPPILTGWAAVAVCETIRQTTHLQAKIKWPNDVLIRGRKVCGILSELRMADGGLRIGNPQSNWAAIVGIGLNVNQPAEVFRTPGLERGTSLAVACGQQFDSDAIARRLIHQLDEEYERLRTGDLATLEACWKWRMGLLGRQVRVECADADHQGRLREMTFDALELEQPGGATLRLRPEMVRHVQLADHR